LYDAQRTVGLLQESLIGCHLVGLRQQIPRPWELNLVLLLLLKHNPGENGFSQSQYELDKLQSPRDIDIMLVGGAEAQKRDFG